MAKSSTSIDSVVLDLPPSCVEVCPAYPEYLLVGTYNLQKEDLGDADLGNADPSHAELQLPGPRKPQSRNGSIVVFCLRDRRAIRVETVFQPSAVLDLHFQQVEGKRDICAVVSSTATISVFKLSATAASESLGHHVVLEQLGIRRISGVGDEVLFLSCSWHPRIPDVVAVSTSTGEVYILGLQGLQGNVEAPAALLMTHSLEAWTVAFSPDLPSFGDGRVSAKGVTLYSGGDDSTLRYVSCISDGVIRSEDASSLDMPYPPVKARGHGAGVTAILPMALTTNDGGRIVITGSYDDRLRVYAIHDPLDTHGLRKVKLLAEKNLEGGVWRLKLISQTAGGDGEASWKVRILASCMHAGARVVDVEEKAGGECRIAVAARFEEHRSMNYGSDFRLDVETGSLLCISTSFYDKLLCLWEVGAEERR